MFTAARQDALSESLDDAGGQSSVLAGPRPTDLNVLERSVLNTKRFKMLRAAINDDAWLARVPAGILVGVADGLRGFYSNGDLMWLDNLARRVAQTPLPIATMGRSTIFGAKIRYFRNK